MQPATQFLVEFGKNLGLETKTDQIGNIIIRKPATPGMENRKGIILQAHIDMVPQKNNDTVHDFTKDPITTIIDGEWMKAKGTTLGADNGLGVAAIMAVLEDKTLKHGPLEALITVDEETGMVGAFGLKAGTIEGDILLNLDSEDEGELYIGCAGGVDVTASLNYQGEAPKAGESTVQITVKGLRGGHSGLEINCGRGNANKLLARVVYQVVSTTDARLVSWKGGNMRNAIPREAEAVLAIKPAQMEQVQQIARELAETFNHDFHGIETVISVLVQPVENNSQRVPNEIRDVLVSTILACPNGVARMIPSVPDTVETSSNLAIIEIDAQRANFKILARSSSDTMKADLALSLCSCFNLAGMHVELSGQYSGWQPNVESPILAAMRSAYQQQFGVEPAVKVIHAGLECGIIGANVPGLDMISFGPTIRSPHSPDEKVNIPSVRKFYEFLTATLENAPLR